MQKGYNEEYESMLKLLYEVDKDAIGFYSAFKLRNGNLLQPCYVNQYTINASVLIACIKLAKIMALRSPAGVARNLHLYATSLNKFLLEKHGVQHTLPVSSRWFSQNFKAFYNDGNGIRYEGAISNKLGNENAVKSKQYNFSSN